MGDFLLGEAAFARPSDSESVNQSEQVVERGIAPGGVGHARVKGLDGGALHLSVWIRPDGRHLLRCADFARQDGGGPGGRHSAGDFLGAGGKGVRHAMDEKVAERFAADFPGLGIDQAGISQSKSATLSHACCGYPNPHSSAWLLRCRA